MERRGAVRGCGQAVKYESYAPGYCHFLGLVENMGMEKVGRKEEAGRVVQMGIGENRGDKSY